MKVNAFFDHCNINVTNLENSIRFYEEAIGLHVKSRLDAPDGSFVIVKLTDGNEAYQLELTWLKNHQQPYNLGENESHICFTVGEQFDKVHKFHKEQGWVCFENQAMGLYFINDPDGYWIEILP